MTSASASAGSNPKRWRVNISDGVHSMSCLLGLPLHQAVESGTLQPNAIVKVETTMTSVIQNRKVAVIVGVTLLSQKHEVVGHPVPFSSTTTAPSSSSSSLTTSTPSVDNNSRGALQSPQTAPRAMTTPSSHTLHPGAGSGLSGAQPSLPPDVVTIAALSPYANQWTLQARLTFKSDIKHWSNARGEGQVFHGILMDASGDIRITGFNQQVDQFYTQLAEQQVYFVRGCKVKLAQREYNPTSCLYELVLEDKSEILPCPQPSSATLPALHLNPTPIADLRNTDNGTLVDLLAVLIHIQPPVPFTSKNTQREMIRRDVGLLDASGWQTRLTLWGKSAQDMVLEVGHVLACKHVKVTDFNGKTVSSLQASTLLLDPDLPSAHRLLGWYQQQKHVQGGGHDDAFPSTSTPMTGGGSSSSMSTASGALSSSSYGGGGELAAGGVRMDAKTEWTTLAELLAHPDRTGWVDATLVFVRESPFTYAACPTCHKKVVAAAERDFCEKCQEPVPQAQPRYIVSVCLADTTAQLWATLFNEAGETLFGQPASDIASPHAAALATNFQRILVKLRSKMEMYQDEARMKHTILDLLPFKSRPDLWLAAAQRSNEKIKLAGTVSAR